MNTTIDSIDTNDSLTVVIDSILENDNTSNINLMDTAVSVSGTTENNFWLKDGQPSGWTQVLLPVGITLFAVFLEKWIAKCYTKKKEKKDREKYRNTIIDWIKLIIPIEESLAESLSDLSNSIAQSDDMQPERYDMPITIPDKVGNMTVEQTMDAFLTDFNGDKKKSSVHIYNIISCMEFLSKTRGEIEKFYDAYNKQAFSYCEQWNVEINAFKEWYVRQVDESIKRIVKLWAAGLIVKKDSIRVHEKLVDEMIQLRSEDTDIAPNLIRMRTIILQRKALTNGYATIFENMSKNINFSLGQLSDACVFFAENKPYKKTYLLNIKRKLSHFCNRKP